MEQNKRECIRCEHLIGCKKMEYKAHDCMYFEERKDSNGREKNVRKDNN